MRKCPICKQKYEPKRNTAEPCPRYECRISLLEKVMPKVKAETKRKEKAKDKVLKDSFKAKHKSLSEYEAEAKKAFQRWIRERDTELPCISCGNANTTDWAGGHYFSAGQYSGLIFDETNVHKQCNTYCNRNLRGNLLEYRKGLIARYGVDYVNELEEKSNRLRKYKYTKHELIEIKEKYSKPYRKI